MNRPQAPALPRYESRWLGDLLPTLLSSLGIGDFADSLAVEPASRVCLVLVDGLGWELLSTNRDAAPFLNSISREPLSTGFPATTAASISSVGIGLPPGEHGLVGYTMALPGYDRAINALTWSLYGLGARVDLRDQLVPEAFQPLPTLAERAAAAGVLIHHLGPAFHEGSGLTRAVGRGERFHPADSLEAIRETALRLLGARQTFVYAYHPRLDAAGHVHGFVRRPGGMSSSRSTTPSGCSLSSCRRRPCWWSRVITAWSTCESRSGSISPTTRTWRPACACWPGKPARGMSALSTVRPTTS